MRKFGVSEWVAVGVALVACAMLFFGGQIMNIFGFRSSTTVVNNPVDQTAAAESQTAQQAGQAATATGANSVTPTKTLQNISTVKGLEVYDEQVGTGDVAKAGQTITAHYIGYLTNGQKFDSSVDRGQPFSFKLGAGQVIKGWDQGIAGMKVGGIRRLVVSPELGYGSQAMGPIPPNSTLIFEVQLLGVK